MMRALDRLEVRQTLSQRIADGTPFFGICLGLQALFETSEEAPEERGLGVFPGMVRRFPAHARVPHMGWNSLQLRRESKLVTGDPFVYFAHSYYAPEGEYTSAACVYEVPYTAVLEQSNVFGVQFHPEKSGPAGLAMVKRFVDA
jgi:imidazole glycerol phosphate synthase glutamine amidotransferase subunit